MAYDQLMHTYMSYGPINDMPPSPNVAPGVAAFYYTTDTALLYVWSGIGWVPAGGGGSAGAVTNVSDVVVGAGGAPNIQFSAIPQAYRHLQLVFDGAGSAGNPNLCLQFNGDTGTNYDRASSFTGNLGAPSGYTETGQTSAVVGAFDAGSVAVMGMVLDIPNYASTTFYKVATSVGTQNRAAGLIGGNNFYTVWRSTAAVSSILLFPSSGTFVQGTVASLYGLS